MDQFFSLLFSSLSQIVSILQSFQFSALGFTISLWDFELAIFVLSVLAPLLFAVKSPRVGSVLNSLHSERNDKK